MAGDLSISSRREFMNFRVASRLDFGMRMLSRGPLAFNVVSGVGLIMAWSGERLPRAGLFGRSGFPRGAVIGFAGVGADFVQFDGESLPEGTWHFAPVRVTGWGHFEIDANRIQTATIGASGVLVARPNAPSPPEAKLLPDFTVRMTWVYAPFNAQLPAADFAVFVTDLATPFDVGTPTDTVAAVAGVTRYTWTDDTPLSIGETRHYTVRARSSGLVGSLLPRVSGRPSTDPDSVALAESVSVTRSA